MTRSLAILWLFISTCSIAQEDVIRVGAKHFNEGYILSEMIALVLEDGGFIVERKFNLGGTAVSFEALRNNAIDIYPEYTGTLAGEILRMKGSPTREAINAELAKIELEISEPFGFSNSYALVADTSLARKYSIRTISDLARHPSLVLGLSYEFLKRKDGWENLALWYELSQQPTALEHGLAYQALLDRKIDVTDAYSTDGEITRYNLLLLEDDQRFFPDYQAVSFYREALPMGVKKLLSKLTSSMTAAEMQHLNANALFEKMDHKEIAFRFLVRKGLIKESGYKSTSTISLILEKTWVHLKLTFLALLVSMIIAIPMGIYLYKRPAWSRAVLYMTGMLQTIPSIALLALLIPLMGIGTLPALVALFLYALLPILRNTVIGLSTVDPVMRNVAAAIGLNSWNRLRLVELPLALPMILAGIRTAAVINIGTATLAAFIGAGGLGEFIVTGLALNNTSLVLQGAIPSALLAILMELVFEGVEWVLVPRHLRGRLSN